MLKAVVLLNIFCGKKIGFLLLLQSFVKL